MKHSVVCAIFFVVPLAHADPDNSPDALGTIPNSSTERIPEAKEDSRRTTVLEGRMDRTIVPEIEFLGARLRDVFDFLSLAGARDNAATTGRPTGGVTIVVSPHVVAEDKPLVTWRVKQVSLLKALKTVVSVADLDYSAEDEWVFVSPKDAGYKVDKQWLIVKAEDRQSALYKKLVSIRIQNIDWHQVDAKEAVGFLDRTAHDGSGTNKVVFSVVLDRTRVKTDLPEVDLQVRSPVSMLDLLKMLSQMWSAECQVDAAKKVVTIVPTAQLQRRPAAGQE